MGEKIWRTNMFLKDNIARKALETLGAFGNIRGKMPQNGNIRDIVQ